MSSLPRKIWGYSAWWLVMGGCLAGVAWVAGGETPSPGLIFAATVANTFLIVGAEQLLPRISGTSLFRDRQTLNDIAHGSLFAFAGRPVAGGAGLALLAWVGLLAERPAAIWPVHWPLPAQVGIGLLGWSFIAYWLHRAFHTFDWMWGFHAIHHDTPQMHLFKSGRIHIGEEMAKYFFIPLPFLALGVPTEVLVWMGLWLIFEGNLAHCNLDQRFPSAFHYFVPTVQLHYIHHAEPRSLHDSNYGGVTPLWDIVFGTYKHPDRHPVERTGLANSPVPRGFLAQVAHPFQEIARLASSRKADEASPESLTEERPL